MSVLESVESDIAEIAKRDKALADSGLAALAKQLAKELDSTGNSATSKSMCAKALMEALEKLRQLAPAESANDRVDELAGRRAKRRARSAAT